MDETLALHPEDPRDRKRPTIQAALDNMYQAAKRVPPLHQHPANIRLVETGSTMSIPQHLSGLQELRVERISDKVWHRWGPRGLKECTATNMADVENNSRHRW